jgi:hypothetical protein
MLYIIGNRPYEKYNNQNKITEYQRNLFHYLEGIHESRFAEITRIHRKAKEEQVDHTRDGRAESDLSLGVGRI